MCCDVQVYCCYLSEFHRRVRSGLSRTSHKLLRGFAQATSRGVAAASVPGCLPGTICSHSSHLQGYVRRLERQTEVRSCASRHPQFPRFRMVQPIFAKSPALTLRFGSLSRRTLPRSKGGRQKFFGGMCYSKMLVSVLEAPRGERTFAQPLRREGSRSVPSFVSGGRKDVFTKTVVKVLCNCR